MKTYDLRFVMRGPVPPPRDVTLVLIDERTDKALPEPRVFWQPHYAAVMRAAAAGGARAIALDVFFALSVEKWEPDFDRQLAAAFMEVSATTPVVLGFDTLQSDQPNLPLYLLGSTQGAMAFTNVTLDDDGFVRRQELQGRRAEARAEAAPEIASFSTRLAAAALGVERGTMDAQRRTLRLGDRTIPLDSAGFMRIHYWGPGGTFPSVSMAEVLEAVRKNDTARLDQWFRGKTVLIGTKDPVDMYSTPFFSSKAGGALTTGVEVHASTLATILEQRFLREISPAASAGIVVAAALIAAALVFRLGFPFAPAVLAGLLAGYFFLAAKLLGSGVVLPVVPPILAIVLSGFASYGAHSLTEGRQRRLLQDTFGRYVSSDIARELLAYGKIPLGGACQQVTVLFSDLRNYTSYCQGRDPQLVVEELNEYFADMTAEIKAHGGMVNKFIGDGIMALFGAPVPHPDDALRAVRCAYRMVQRNEEYNRRRKERGLPPLVIGIGLHTGEAVVGNIGAPDKMEYTAIGDTVNVAARIESENKTFDSRLLISGVTYELVAGHVYGEPAGYANMKGVAKPVLLYKIIELKGGTA